MTRPKKPKTAPRAAPDDDEEGMAEDVDALWADIPGILYRTLAWMRANPDVPGVGKIRSDIANWLGARVLTDECLADAGMRAAPRPRGAEPRRPPKARPKARPSSRAKR